MPINVARRTIALRNQLFLFMASDSESDDSAPVIDLHSVDIESETFRSLPLREKHDLLTELKETRKMNSWGKLHELPKQSGDFSNYQMNRLLKRRKLQECLEETEKEMGGNFMSINELENLLKEEGIETKLDSLPTKRIAYDDRTRYLLIKDMKKAKEEAREVERRQLLEKQEAEETVKTPEVKVDTVDEELKIAIQMSLECVEEKKEGNSPDSTFMLDTDYSDSEEDEQSPFIEFSSAKSYIMQNTDFTKGAIEEFITSKSAINKKSKSKLKTRETKYKISVFKPTELSSESDEGNQEDSNVSKASTVEDTSYISAEESKITSSGEIIHSNLETKQKFDKIIDLIVTSSDEDCIEINEASDNEPNVAKSESESNEDDDSKEVPENVTKSESQSSEDDDFEEVPENVKPNAKVVAELKINYENKIEDEIFADVFTNATKTMFNIDKDVLQPEINVLGSKNIENDDKIEKLSNREIRIDTFIVVDKNNTLKTIFDENKPSEAFVGDENEPSETVVVDKNKISETVADDDVKTSETVEFDKVHPNNLDLHVIDEPKEITEINEPPRTPPKPAETIANEKPINDKPKLTNEELTAMAENLRKEGELLEEEKGKLDRMSRNISDEMTRDAKELLRMFGIPYIVAPTEAEAQCAFLECANLTDGTITDDSDIWLFGGRTVYKNFFDQRKHVLQFQAEKIERSFNLSRDQLILLALLVGSDYTLGVRGVGPVTAMEILASFPPTRKDKLTAETATSLQVKSNALLVGLQEFKRWVKSGKRTDDTSLRNKLKNITVTDEFPSVRVVQAYLEPKVNKSKETFTWGHPDVTTLRDFSRNKFGWSQSKFDEIITPVLKRMQATQAQKSLTDYFKKHIQHQDVQLSKRVKAAVEKMGPETQATKQTKPVRKRKAKVESELFSKIEDITAPTTSQQISNSESVSTETFDIKVPKLNRYQEIIPQRERNRLNVVQTKLRAIELYRKTKIDKQVKKKKRMAIKPKDDAGLSESDTD